MLFNSLHFCVFFLVTTCIYFALPMRGRLLFLGLSGCYFYMAFIPSYILILFAVIALDYWAALWIDRSPRQRARVFLIVSLIANIGFLGIFKYYAFLTANISWATGLAFPTLSLVLPVGLSFHTFQSMAYTIEVYRGRFKPERNLLRYSVYVLFYPQLVAGPIERPYNLLPQLRELPRPSADDVTEGLRLMLWGLFKKSVIADTLALYVNEVYAAPGQYTGAPLLFATVFFAIQIYCDFSGYSDIGIGAAQVLGIRLMENFRRPYMASSLEDFWRRWHISLSSWFRDYLYIPLGGSRGSRTATARNLMVTFLVSGLWHGANWTFVIWGALHGVGLCISRLCRVGLPGPPRWALTMAFVLVTWVFFRAATLADAAYILMNWWPDGAASTLGRPYEFALSWLFIGILFGTHLLEERTGAHFPTWLGGRPAGERWTLYWLLLLTIAFFGRFSNAEFIYFQF